MKRILKLIVIIMILAIMIICLLGIFGKFNGTWDKLEHELKSRGQDFYEKFYYVNLDDDIENKKTILKNFDDGIIVTLENLLLYDDTDIELIESSSCNYQQTKVIIWPREPYGSEDYDIEVVLSCNF